MHIVVCTERSEDHFWDRFSSSTMWAPGQEGDGFLFLHVAHRKEGTSEVAGRWQALQLHVHLLGDVIWEAVFRAWWPLEASLDTQLHHWLNRGPETEAKPWLRPAGPVLLPSEHLQGSHRWKPAAGQGLLCFLPLFPGVSSWTSVWTHLLLCVGLWFYKTDSSCLVS